MGSGFAAPSSRPVCVGWIFFDVSTGFSCLARASKGAAAVTAASKIAPQIAKVSFIRLLRVRIPTCSWGFSHHTPGWKPAEWIRAQFQEEKNSPAAGNIRRGETQTSNWINAFPEDGACRRVVGTLFCTLRCFWDETDSIR